MLRRSSAYLAKMPEAIQGQEGSKPFMAAVRSMVWGFDLGIEGGIRIITDEYSPRCVPPWSDSEIRRACERANEGGDKPRGHLLRECRERSPTFDDPKRPVYYDFDEGQFRIPLSECIHLCELPGDPAPALSPPADPNTPVDTDLPPPPAGGPEGVVPPRPVLQPGVDEDDPQHLAALFLHSHRRPDGLTLRSWRNQWYIWEQGAYRELPDDEVEDIAVQSAAAELNARHQSRSAAPGFRQQEAAGADMQSRLPAKKKITTTLTRNVLHNARGQAAVRSEVEPCWLDCDKPPAGTMVAFKNGVLDLGAHIRCEPNDFVPPTPRYFTRNRLDFEYRPDPPSPNTWFRTLRQYWPGENADSRDSIALLQQWAGYIISGDNSRQKFLAMIGAPNGGKGVICDVLRALAGQNATASPTLHSLSGDFGLAALDGKSLAIIGDMRVSAKTDVSVAVERILNIAGGGHSIVNAKNKAERGMKLSTRFVMASNGLPKLFDSSSALIRRTLMLRFTVSFADNPDPTLADSLMSELPGIFAWAVDGLRMLNEQGHFTQPASGRELIDEFRGMMSSHSMFIADRCILDPQAWESFDDLYKDWKGWCEEEGKKDVGSKTTFKAKLREVVPTLLKSRPRSGNPDRKEGYQGIRLRHLDELSEV